MVYETPVFWTFRMCLKWDDKQVTSYLCGAWWYAPNTDIHKVEGAFRRESTHMLSNCSNEPVRKAHSGKPTLPFAVCVHVCVGMHACVCVHGDQQDGCSSGAISFVYWESLVSENLLLGLGASWWGWDGWPTSLSLPPQNWECKHVPPRLDFYIGNWIQVSMITRLSFQPWQLNYPDGQYTPHANEDWKLDKR